jgi:predicted outer membrane protein
VAFPLLPLLVPLLLLVLSIACALTADDRTSVPAASAAAAGMLKAVLYKVENPQLAWVHGAADGDSAFAEDLDARHD